MGRAVGWKGWPCSLASFHPEAPFNIQTQMCGRATLWGLPADSNGRAPQVPEQGVMVWAG